MMNEKKNILLWISLGILGIITFYPLLQVGIVTGDDLGYMLWPLDHFKSDVKTYAEGTGRFYFLITLWVYKIPYLIESPIYFYSMFILPLIGSFLLFIGLIYRIFKSEKIALLSALMACSIFQITGGHSATAAYPFYFSFSFSLLLISIHFLISYLRKQKYGYLILSSIIFAITTIFYESYLVFYVFIFFIIISQYPFRNLFTKQILKRISKELVPFVIFGITYLLVYYLYYRSCPTQYTGNTFSSNFDFSLFIKAMGNMAFYALPLSSLYDYQFFLTEYSLSSKQTVHLIELIFTQAGIAAYIKGIITIIIAIVIYRFQKDTLNNRKMVFIAFIGIVFIFFPHLPLALSEKYSSAIQNAYVTTYFAFFALVLVLITISIYVFNKTFKKKWVNIITFTIFSFILFFVTLTTQFINERVVQDLSVAQKRLDIMEKMLIKEHISQGSSVYVEQLHLSTSFFSKSITRQGSPFSLFAKVKNGLEIEQYLEYPEFYKKYKDQDQKVYLIYFSQSNKTGDCQMLIVPRRGVQLTEQFHDNKCDSMIAGYLSNYKKFSVSLASDSINEVSISGFLTQMQGNFHYANVTFHNKPEVSIFNLKGNDIHPSTVMISNQLYHNAPLHMIGKYPKNYKSRWVKHIMRDLEKNQELVRMIEQKAKDQGISFQQSLKNDAQWLLYNNNQ